MRFADVTAASLCIAHRHVSVFDFLDNTGLRDDASWIEDLLRKCTSWPVVTLDGCLLLDPAQASVSRERLWPFDGAETDAMPAHVIVDEWRQQTDHGRNETS